MFIHLFPIRRVYFLSKWIYRCFLPSRLSCCLSRTWFSSGLKSSSICGRLLLQRSLQQQPLWNKCSEVKAAASAAVVYLCTLTAQHLYDIRLKPCHMFPMHCEEKWSRDGSRTESLRRSASFHVGDFSPVKLFEGHFMTNVMTLVHDDDHPIGLNASVWQDREVIDCTRQSEYIPPLVCLLLGNNLKHQANKRFILWSSDHEESLQMMMMMVFYHYHYYKNPQPAKKCWVLSVDQHSGACVGADADDSSQT